MIVPAEARIFERAETDNPARRASRERPRKSRAAPQLSGASAWSMLPEQKPDGTPNNGMVGSALSLTAGLNGTEVAQSTAGERFRRIIEPIVNSERYGELHDRFNRKQELIEHLAKENGLSARTIYRWLGEWETKGITGLVRRARTDKGISRALNDAGREFILGAVMPKHGAYGELSTRDVFRAYEEERRWRAEHADKPLCPADRARYWRYIRADGGLLPSAQLPGASYATFCRWVSKIPKPLMTMARHGNEAYRNAELITYRDLTNLQVLDYVVMDHRVLDIFCLIPERGRWKLGRPWITAAIDMRSRKWLGWCIVETPSSDSIAAVLKQVFSRFGLPKSVYWDNGKDFRCQWFEGRKEQSCTAAAVGELPGKWTGVLESLGVRVHHAIVKNARAKIIEPNFINIANFDRTLPEWCGHKPGARPERFSRILREHEAWLSGERAASPFRTIQEIAALYSEAVEDLNEREHSGEGMRKATVNGMGWMCPNECFEILVERVPRRTVPDEVLQLCFAKRRELTVRNGEVRVAFGGQQYHYRLQDSRTALLSLNNRAVELAYDPLDLGQAAIYYQGRFIGLAQCFELRRMGEDAFVQDERDRRAARREVKRFIAAVHQAVPVPDIDTQIARRRAIRPQRTEPDRPEVQAELPEAICHANAAHAAERAVSFSAATAAIQIAERPPTTDDDEFNFFSKGDEA